MTRILLIEDDVKLANSIALALAEHGGIVCDITKLGSEAIKISKLYDYELIILDLMLPDIDGYQVLLKLRALKIKSPVLILSGLSALEQKIKGLNNGAEDYITKPFDYNELIARIQVILRRNKGDQESIVKVDDMVIDMKQEIVTINNQKLDLTPTEYAIMKLMATTQGVAPLNKHSFFNYLSNSRHGYETVDKNKSKNVLVVFISKLRSKIKSINNSDPDKYIVTIRGLGYRLKDLDTSITTYS